MSQTGAILIFLVEVIKILNRII